MLFIYDDPEDISFWMKDTNIPLDIIFINDNYSVIKVSEGSPNSEELQSCKGVRFELELNTNSGIKEGDELEIIDDSDMKITDPSRLLLLDENGDVQMKLDGGERIFSRKNTKTLLRMANRAYNSKKDSDYRSLGKKVFEYLKIQNERPDEHVTKDYDKQIYR